MSERRNKLDAKNKMYAYIGAGIVHAIIIGALIFNFASKPKSIETFDADKIDVVKATTVDESAIKQQQDKLKRAERERERNKEREQKRLKDLKAQAEREKKSIEELKLQQEKEKKKAAELEEQRRIIALKKKKEEEQRKKEDAARKKKEDEARKKQEKERIAQEKELLESQRRLEESLAAEQAFLDAQQAKERTTTLIAKYGALVERRVDSFRTISPDFESWRVTEINIKLSPLGVVQQTRIVKSSGSALYDKSVEDAILKASPLPIPDVTLEPEANALFQNINYKFRMPGA